MTKQPSNVFDLSNTFDIVLSNNKPRATKEEVIYALLGVNAPKAAPGTKRPDIHIAVALDISSSMCSPTRIPYLKGSEIYSVLENARVYYGGRVQRRPYGQEPTYVVGRHNTSTLSKFGCAVFAVDRLIEYMEEGDSLTLVTFANHATKQFNLQMSQWGKEKAREALFSITPHGCTALWDGARECARALQQDESDATKRLFLFTDGQANTGPSTLREIRASMAKLPSDMLTNASISTFGMGRDYSSKLLDFLARGGGSHYYLKDEEQISVAFGSELAALQSPWAKEVEISAQVSEEAVKVEVVNPLPGVKVQHVKLADIGYVVTVPCPDLLSEQRFNVALKVTLKKRSRILKNPVKLIRAEIYYHDVANKADCTIGKSCSVQRCRIADAVTQDDPGVMELVAIHEAAQAQKEADELAKKGEVKKGHDRLLRGSELMSARGRDDLKDVLSTVALSGYTSDALYKGQGGKMSSSVISTLSTQQARTGGATFGNTKLDAQFANPAQREMTKKFAITKTQAQQDDDMPDVDVMVTG